MVLQLLACQLVPGKRLPLKQLVDRAAFNTSLETSAAVITIARDGSRVSIPPMSFVVEEAVVGGWLLPFLPGRAVRALQPQALCQLMSRTLTVPLSPAVLTSCFCHHMGWLRSSCSRLVIRCPLCHSFSPYVPRPSSSFPHRSPTQWPLAQLPWCTWPTASNGLT